MPYLVPLINVIVDESAILGKLYHFLINERSLYKFFVLKYDVNLFVKGIYRVNFYRNI